MAKAARTFGATIDATGRVHVKYNAGPTPLPDTWQGMTMVFPSREALTAELMSAQDNIGDDLLVLMCCAEGWTKFDPSMIDPASLMQREAQLEMIAAGSVVRMLRR